MSDNADYEKSIMVQNVEFLTPFSDGNFNYINDINGGNYNSAGLSLVQWDLSSIFNSQKFLNFEKSFFAIPTITATGIVSSLTAGTLVTPSTSAVSPTVHGWKNSFLNLIHSSEFILNGKTVCQNTPYCNVYQLFRIMCRTSQNDLNGLMQSLGWSKVLDNWQSYKFSSPALQNLNIVGGTFTSPVYPSFLAVSGATGTSSNVVNCVNGLSNNQAFGFSSGSSTTINFPDSGDQGNVNAGSLYTGAYNNALYQRISRLPDITNASVNNMFGGSGSGLTATSLMSSTQLSNEFKPYTVITNNVVVSYDVALIPANQIIPFFGSAPLCKRLDGQIRLFMNTGAVGSVVQTAIGNVTTTSGQPLMITSGSVNTFVGTCPIMQCNRQTIETASGVGLVTSLSIARQAPTNIFGLNLANSIISIQNHPMNTCRFYYEQVQLKIDLYGEYIANNMAKKICFSDFYYQLSSDITSGANYAQLVQSGIRKIKSIIIIPFQSPNQHGAVSTSLYASGVSTFSPLISPFDTAPATTGPLSLINVNCNLGGSQVLSLPLQYDFQTFLQQIKPFDAINGTFDLGMSAGLLNQEYWSNAYRPYVIDCSRCNNSDFESPKNITVSLQSNCLVTIQCFFFVEYASEWILNVETGDINKL